MASVNVPIPIHVPLKKKDFSLQDKIKMKNTCDYDNNFFQEIKSSMIPSEKTAIIMVGMPASGKSTIKTSFVENYLGRKMSEFINCDPDIIIEKLKERVGLRKRQEQGQEKGKSEGEIDCYYNAREINDIIYTLAQRDNYNIILDGTGQDYIWTSGQIENLYNIGYTIYICIVLISLDQAKERASKRQRVIPPNKTEEVYYALIDAIDLYKTNKRATEVVVYDNTGEKGRAHFEVFKNGKLTEKNGIESDEKTTFLGGRKRTSRKRTSRKRTSRKWSIKYKKSINCSRPKGFSQKQYCKYGRKHIQT